MGYAALPFEWSLWRGDRHGHLDCLWERRSRTWHCEWPRKKDMERVEWQTPGRQAIPEHLAQQALGLVDEAAFSASVFVPCVNVASRSAATSAAASPTRVFMAYVAAYGRALNRRGLEGEARECADFHRGLDLADRPNVESSGMEQPP